MWDKYFGGTRHDYLVSAIATEEGGFIMAGTSYSNASGDKTENNLGGADVWLVRVSENGDEIWQKTLGTKSNDEASAIVQTLDKGFFVAGNINSNKDLFGSKDVFVSKLDKEGNLITTLILGGSGLDEVQDMLPTEDGGCLLVTYSRSGITNPLNLKKEINESSQSPASNFIFKGQQEASINYQPKTNENDGEGDYWLVKLDKNAHVEWQKTYGGVGDDRPKTMALTENGYLIGGESRSQSSGSKKDNVKEGTDLWIIAIDKAGDELWQKSYSFGNRDVLMSANTIRKTNKDNISKVAGFLLGGYTQAEGKMEFDDEKFWMLYINTEGKEEWRKHIEGKSRKKEERLVSAKLQTDGTFLLAGTSAEELGKENWKIVKLGDKKLEDLIEQRDLRIYPNPVEDYCFVEIGFESFPDRSQGGEQFEATIQINDMSGRQIQLIKTTQQVTKINTASFPQGVYLVTAKTVNKSVNAKIVKK